MTTSTIPTRPLGKSGLEVTEVGCGLWAAGGAWGPTDDAGAIEAIEVALESGVTFFDTADVYGDGHSERLLGKAMKGRRDRFIVGTKLGWTNFDGDKGQSQYTTVEKLIAGVESNLQRLGTDYVDLIQCHIYFEDPTTPVFLEGFARLKEQGKVRAWGCSTSGLGLVKTFAEAGADSLQIDYSILNRDPENEVLPYCKEHGVGVIVRGPLAMGILTGKFKADQEFAADDFRKAWIDNAEQNAQYVKDLESVERLSPLASEPRSLAQTALKFVLAHDAVTTVIPGARNRRQAESNSAAGSMPPLSAIEMSLIGGVVTPGGGRKIWPAEG
ncbi:MAG: myo-inositol catabolism protein IolS [Phycisphaerales bacterium]|jgi:myo-inositol catabolism protein IolS